MSPTILREAGLRFYFFSREEPRPHVHVQSAEGEAKFWLEPEVALAHNFGLGERRLRDASTVIQEHYDEFRTAWRDHFGG